ncbi:MAG: Lrp/AsnC family transcriptional regulator [Calditrichaceae bacterium]|nr:Lrp/AsnC family transcriptional regulator [Calditrichia bacterium]NUQ41159.1 Lrp/AsnC family transcriptional regulator [Calditrichaceae bacterium]
MIDAIDAQILAIVQENARTPNAEIARQVGMAASAVLERIRKLEERGVIKGYQVSLEPKYLDLDLLAFIFVRTRDPYGSLETARYLATLPEVQEVHHIAGEDCYLIKVRARDPEALGLFLREKIAANKNVTYTRTTIVLETLKETFHLPLNTQSGENSHGK